MNKGVLPIKNLYILIIVTLMSCNNIQIIPPKATKTEKRLTIHNNSRTDNYYWLRDIDNPEVLKYLQSENEYLNKSLKHTIPLQNAIFEEIISGIHPRDKSVPYKENGYFYFSEYREQTEHPVYYRQSINPNSKKELLLDINEMSLGYPFFDIDDISISPDNKIIAYSLDTIGEGNYEIRFKNLETNKVLKDIVTNTDGTAVWANDNKTIFYITNEPETHREYRICKHILNTNSKNDKIVFEEKDETFHLQIFRSNSDKFIIASSISTLSTEYRVLSTDEPNSNFKIFQKREKNHEYHIEHHKDDFFILSNSNALNFKIFKTNIEKTDKSNWIEVIKHQDNVFIEEFEVLEKFLVLKERHNNIQKFNIINLENDSNHYIQFDDDIYEITLTDNYDFKSDYLRYSYSSLATPSTYYDYNMLSKQKKVLKKKFVSKNFQKENYQTQLLYVDSDDNEKIPVSLVYKKGRKPDGNNPLVLYAYGSYGISSEVYFQHSIVSLLDRGFIYGIAHVRGGQEKGREWYENGKLLKKKNTFNDFIKCSEYLIERGYTNSKLLFACGESAGGLLMGAISNMRPELYAGIIAEVPFVDVVTTMLDKTIPLTTGEYDEWGNPNKIKYYDYILSYSPYDQVKKTKYPNMFITACLNDSHVPFWEPAKWSAKLREYNTGDNFIFLHTNTGAGHNGATGRFEAFKETALIYSFMIDIVNKNRE